MQGTLIFREAESLCMVWQLHMCVGQGVLYFFITAFSRYNSHAIQFLYLEYILND